MCGVFGITNTEHASKLIYFGLFALQHRGQESAGISVLNENTIKTHRDTGLVCDIFNEKCIEELNGSSAIGHVRYSTAGGKLEANIQPITARIGGSPVALSHNGNIVNANDIRSQLEANGAILQGTADTELVLHLMARSNRSSFLERLMDAFEKCIGAFSLLILTPTHLYAAVDACGYRPLSLGKMPRQDNETSWVLSSETCAMDLVDAEFIRDLAPGEILSIELATGKTQSCYFNLTSQQNIRQQHAKCVFEHVYFARPDSQIWGIPAFDARFEMGKELARQDQVEADMVIAVPDSGIPMAMGYAEESKLPYRIGLIRNHYVGRTFIKPTQDERALSVRLKLNPMREVVHNKRIIVIDDSIVRGTTSRKIIEELRNAGAQEIHMRISSPPVRYPCFYGIDTPKRKELLAQQMDIKGMRDFLRTDSLVFLDEENLISVMRKFTQSKQSTNLLRTGYNQNNGGWCTSCFSGEYQDHSSQKIGCPEKCKGV